MSRWRDLQEERPTSQRSYKQQGRPVAQTHMSYAGRLPDLSREGRREGEGRGDRGRRDEPARAHDECARAGGQV